MVLFLGLFLFCEDTDLVINYATVARLLTCLLYTSRCV